MTALCTALPEQLSLLLVDDHPIILLAVKSLIESKLPNYRLHSAASRNEALVLAESVKPKLAPAMAALTFPPCALV